MHDTPRSRPRTQSTAAVPTAPGAAIAGTATALPAHTLTRDSVKLYMERVFGLEGRRLDAMMAVIDNARVDQRRAIFPVEYIVERRPLAQTTIEYQEHAIRLGHDAAEACLRRAGMSARDVDMIITVSCTGFMIPSLDAHLINLMGFRSDVRRLPVTELGCAAGAMALSRAWEFVRAFPAKTALIIAVELPTLTFQRDDPSQANLISCVLFGDGAAAALVTGRRTNGLHIVDAETYTFPQSLDAMGFDLRDTGFHIVLSKDVPQLIRDRIADLVDRFVARSGLTRRDIAAFLLHPGGQKLLSYVEEELGLTAHDTRLSWEVLREYGNLSSATILFILHKWLTQGAMDAGDYALAAAFGPGFSAELLLMQWT